MASEIRANKQTNRAGLGTITIADTGVVVNGIVTCTEISGLNALNIAGVSTFASPLDINGDIDVDGHTNLDNLSVAGVTTTAGDLTVGSGGENSALGVRINSAYAQIKLPDGQTGANEKGTLFFGDGDDFTVVHDGYHNYVRSNNGWIIIKNSAGNNAVIIKGNNATEIYHTNSLKVFETTAKGIQVGTGVTIETNGQATFTGIVTASTYYGDGSNLSNITSTTINNNADNRLITGSGTANTLNGESTLTYDGTNLDLGDAKKIRLGASQDLQIYHDTESYIKSATASVNLILESAHDAYIKHGGENMIKCAGDGAVELYYDNSKKIETTSAGGTLTGDLTVTGIIYGGSHISILDSDGSSDMLKIGADEDLRIYHYNNNTYIRQHTDKPLVIGGTSTGQSLYIQPKSGEDSAIFKPNGAAELYYDNVKKIETSSAGITITGAQTTNSGGATNVMNCGSTDTALKLNSTNSNGPHMRFQYDGTDIHFIGSGDGFTPSADREDFAIRFKDRFFFSRDNTNCWYIDGDMHFIPASNNTYDIGRSDTRVRNIYTNDLNLSNEGSSNDVDGTWGDYTIQEGESDLFLINNRSGKKYKFNLTEVS